MGPICNGSVYINVRMVYVISFKLHGSNMGPISNIYAGTHMRPLYNISIYMTDEMFIFIRILWGHGIFFLFTKI